MSRIFRARRMKPFAVLTATAVVLQFFVGVAAADPDWDADGVPDATDNCPAAFNAHQQDADGDGVGDACDTPVRYGRFADYMLGVDEDRQLRHEDGTPVLPAEVPSVYGTPDGMTVFSGGLDVASWDYAAVRGWGQPLRPAYQDLSDAGGWPTIDVVPGTVAIDPGLGRFMFAAGDDEPISLVGQAWTGFGVAGNGFVEVGDDYAYLPAGEGEVSIIDVSDPANAHVVGSEGIGFNFVVALVGEYLYAPHGPGGIAILGISDPTDIWHGPHEIWSPPGSPTPGVNAIKVRGDYAYVTVSADPAFYVLDVSDPLAPVEVASVSVGDPAGGLYMFLSGDRAYVDLLSAQGLLDGLPWDSYIPRQGGFAVIDIADPQAPSLSGVYLGEPDQQIERYTIPKLVGVTDDLALMTTKWRPDNYSPSQPAELMIVDASDPAQPVARGRYAFTDAGGNEGWVDLYSAATDGRYVYVTNDANDSTSDSLSRLKPEDLTKREDYTGLITFNIVDPDNPVVVDRYDYPGPSRFRHLTLDGNRLYVNDYNYGLRIFDLADPSRPALQGGTHTPAEGHYAWVSDDASRAFFTQTFGGTMHNIDISEPTSPARQGAYWDGEWNTEWPLTGRGNNAYVPTDAAINIIDVSDSDAPVKIGEFPAVNAHSPLSLFGEYAYVLTAKLRPGVAPRSELHVYDISNPRLPVLVGVLDLSPEDEDLQKQRWKQIFAQGDRVYIAADKRLVIVDVADPTQPLPMGELADSNLDLSSREEAGRMWIADGYAYVVPGHRDDQLLHIIDVFDPAAPTFVATFTGPYSHVTDVIVEGDHLYLGRYFRTPAVYDLGNPAAPTFREDASAALATFGGWPNAWSLGRFARGHLAFPTLSHLVMLDLPRDAQGPLGVVTVAANLNEAPMVSADQLHVSADEGQPAINTGTVSDLDGDTVTLITSAGTVSNNGDGTWAWSLSTSDGPAENQAVTVDGDDGKGGIAWVTFELTVNNVAPAVEHVAVRSAPTNINEQPISAVASFSDPADSADEPYTCTVDYGDGSGPIPGEVAGTNCIGPGYTYEDAGVYTVTVEVTDKDGAVGRAEAETYLVIYDPDGGFVTGGGWIDSPSGVYADDPPLVGKGTFGFVSKYKKGASTPSGNTEFQFKAGALNFHADIYDWLVIAGQDKAKYKGTGTINGSGNYGFMLTAVDNGNNGDTFRIKIWDRDAGDTVVYDNKTGSDDSYAGTVIGGGNIRVHKK